MSPAKRRELVDRQHQTLSIVQQCALLGVSRSSLYYRPKETSQQDLSLMREMNPPVPGNPFLRIQADEGIAGAARHAGKPEAGTAAHEGDGAAGYLPAASHQPTGAGTPGLSLPAEGPDDYPAQPRMGGRHHLPAHGPGLPLLGRDHELAQPVVVAWRLSNTLETALCAEALSDALNQGTPEVMNTDQGSQFTSREFT